MSPYSDDWSITKVIDRGYLGIYKVKRRRNRKTETAYFKYIKPKSDRYIGPLLANELLAYRLGKLVGLPLAPTQLATINGQVGILSFARSGHRIHRWQEFQRKRSRLIERSIVHPKRLQKTFVFDVWICNIDRSQKNIMLYRNQYKYDFYLIDHELCLLGALKFEKKPWHSGYWESIRAYTRGYHPALMRSVHNYREVSSYVRQIQRISSAVIEETVESIPSPLLSNHQKRVLMKFLLRRQKRLPYIIQRYLRHVR